MVPACALHHQSVSVMIQDFPNCTVPHTQKWVCRTTRPQQREVTVTGSPQSPPRCSCRRHSLAEKQPDKRNLVQRVTKHSKILYWLRHLDFHGPLLKVVHGFQIFRWQISETTWNEKKWLIWPYIFTFSSTADGLSYTRFTHGESSVAEGRRREWGPWWFCEANSQRFGSKSNPD